LLHSEHDPLTPREHHARDETDACVPYAVAEGIGTKRQHLDEPFDRMPAERADMTGLVDRVARASAHGAGSGEPR
jgi:hypothetical protein